MRHVVEKSESKFCPADIEEVSYNTRVRKRNRDLKYCLFKSIQRPCRQFRYNMKGFRFLSEMFKVGRNLKYSFIVGDRKTYKYLRKPKYQYRPAMNWLLPFPGDWHVCKIYLKVLMKIYWHAGLKNMAGKAGNKTKILNSLENRKNDLILIMTPEKQDKTLELSKHWSVDSTPARNEHTTFLFNHSMLFYDAKLMHFMKAYLLIQTKTI